MEKDIEILEKYLRNSAYRRKNSDFFKDGGWEVVDLEIPEALEHLLKEYKELKNNYINPSKARISYYDTKKETKVVIEGFIPKSLIKEKIEELKKELERDKICIDFVIEHTKDIELMAKIQVLEELLGEE